MQKARELAAEAERREPEHFGTVLLSVAATAWTGGWPVARPAFANLLQRWHKPGAHGRIWTHRERIAALLREVQRQGFLHEVVEELEPIADGAWRPWFEATKSVVEGQAVDAMSDAKARTVYELLVARDR